MRVPFSKQSLTKQITLSSKSPYCDLDRVEDHIAAGIPLTVNVNTDAGLSDAWLSRVNASPHITLIHDGATVSEPRSVSADGPRPQVSAAQGHLAMLAALLLISVSMVITVAVFGVGV